MRCLPMLCGFLAVACHSKRPPSETLSRAATDAGAEADVPEQAYLPRFAGPIAAARLTGATAVLAHDRGAGRLVLAKFDDAVPSNIRTTSLELASGVNDLELLGSSTDLALLVRGGADGSDAPLFYRVRADGDAGVTLGDPLSIGTVACATIDGLFSLRRDGSLWKGSFRSLSSEGDEIAGPTVNARSEITLVCGQHRAFVAVNTDGAIRVLAWSASDFDPRPTSLPKPPGSDDDALMTAMDDQLVVANLKGAFLNTLVWQPGGGKANWHKASLSGGDEVTLEAVEAVSGFLGLLMLRTTDAAKACRGGDAMDAVAEVAILDIETGKLVHPPERIETWRCGAEPGPFFSGWANGKLVIAWPRGADAACARAGVRHGGVGFAEVDPKSGRARVGRAGTPAEAVTSAGCDGAKCYAAVVTRGTDPCGPADGREAGRLAVIPYPP
jgi:hypothetical protein